MTIENIRNQILAEKANQKALNGLDSTSKSGLFYLAAHCVAVVIFLQYEFYDTYKIELDKNVREQKKYSQLW